jgi:hypothetical protein
MIAHEGTCEIIARSCQQRNDLARESRGLPAPARVTRTCCRITATGTSTRRVPDRCTSAQRGCPTPARAPSAAKWASAIRTLPIPNSSARPVCKRGHGGRCSLGDQAHLAPLFAFCYCGSVRRARLAGARDAPGWDDRRDGPAHRVGNMVASGWCYPDRCPAWSCDRGTMWCVHRAGCRGGIRSRQSRAPLRRRTRIDHRSHRDCLAHVRPRSHDSRRSDHRRVLRTRGTRHADATGRTTALVVGASTNDRGGSSMRFSTVRAARPSTA